MSCSTLVRCAGSVGYSASFLFAVLGLCRSANAAIVTLSPTHVNTILSAVPTTTFDNNDNFSTYRVVGTGNIQRTIVGTTNADLLAALQAALGPAPSYQINSAQLTVGSDSEDYAPTNGVTAHLLLVPYNTSQATWNLASTGTPWSTAGLAAGVDYDNANLSTPTANGANKTDFLGLGSTVQNWLNTPSSNAGIFFFATSDSGGNENFTPHGNVVWTLDAVAVPEPTTFSLLLGAGVGLSAMRRRHTIKNRQTVSLSCAR